jgi:hypothetical protein
MTMAATDTDLVYNMTKAMVELYNDYKDGAPGNLGWDIKRQIFAWAIPMHEGAVRYYKERGLWTAEHKNNDVDQASGHPRGCMEGVSADRSGREGLRQGLMKARAAALTKAGMDVVVTEW